MSLWFHKREQKKGRNRNITPELDDELEKELVKKALWMI